MSLTRRNLLASASALAFASRALSTAARDRPQRFRIAPLPLLPGGDYSSVSAINNHGQAVGLSSNGQTIVSGLLRDTRAVLWQDSHVVDLVGRRFTGPHGFRINDRGQILINWQLIGSSQPGSVPPPEDYAVLWDGKVQRFWRQRDGFIPTNLNNRGDIVGRSPAGNWHAALWRNGKAVPIVFPANVVSSQALAISDAGLVAGTFAREQDHGEDGLFVWQEGKLETMPADSKRTAYYPEAVSANGQVVGIFREPRTRKAHYCVWQAGKLKDRGALGREGLVHGINGHGDAVGKADWGAFLASGNAVQNLSALLPPGSGWTLNEATGINDRMQIVGNGEFQGQNRAYLLTPEG